MTRFSDLNRFYDLLFDLERRTEKRRLLCDCHGKMIWPSHGVYFVFEPDEWRRENGAIARVVRVGSHAVTATSRSTLWGRLRQHRGTAKAGGGNHRGSIFRLLIGEALMNREPRLRASSWGIDTSISHNERQNERNVEERVSAYLGQMAVLTLPVPTTDCREHSRSYIERNSIAFLSNSQDRNLGNYSDQWLGKHSGREKVRRSGLWNNNHVDENYDPNFLKTMERLAIRRGD